MVPQSRTPAGFAGEGNWVKWFYLRTMTTKADNLRPCVPCKWISSDKHNRRSNLVSVADIFSDCSEPTQQKALRPAKAQASFILPILRRPFLLQRISFVAANDHRAIPSGPIPPDFPERSTYSSFPSHQSQEYSLRPR